MKRRVFSDEFKLEAVRLTQHCDVTKAQVASELGISPALLGRWARDVKDFEGTAFPGRGNPRDAELSAIKRELARVRKERGFLREAATFFAKGPK